MPTSTQYAKYTGLGGSGGGGVTSLNSETGALDITAGNGIAVTTPTSSTIQIASTSAGDVTIGAFGSTPNANGLSINGSQVLNMQPADGTHPGGVSIGAQTIAGAKTFSAAILGSDGSNSAPGYSFSADTDTGVYRIGANDLAIAAGSFAGLEVKKSTGNFANVGVGSAPSASDNYPVLIQRSNTSAGTYIQISNPDTSASSKATYQVAADLGANTGEVSVFTAATATDAYAGRMVVRPSDSTAGLSLIGGDQASGTVRVYTGGDYTSAGKTAQFEADHTTTFYGKINGTAANFSGLTASQAVVTDASKNLASLAYTSANTATTLVERDGSGNFSAGTITATVTGTASGNTTISGQTNHGVVISGAGNAMTSTGAGTAGIPLIGAGASADPVFGTAVVGGGGTGLNAVTAHYLMIGNGTSALTLLAPSATSGAALVSQGSSSDPAYGTVAVSSGGTGQTSYTNGQLLIGNTTGNTLAKATLTAGTGIAITNGAGAITVAASYTAATISVVTGSTHTGGFPANDTGIYTTGTGVLWLEAFLVGPGGGGAGSGTASSSSNGAAGGSDTTFGTLTAGKGSGCNFGGDGGAGGSATVGAGWTDMGSFAGSPGGSANYMTGTNFQLCGSNGGASFFGGAGLGKFTGAGGAAQTNTGSGGGGGVYTGASSGYTGGGGGAGGFVHAKINPTPNQTFAYDIGPGGAGGSAGTSGYAGGAGADSIIIIVEHYQ